MTNLIKALFGDSVSLSMSRVCGLILILVGIGVAITGLVKWFGADKGDKIDIGQIIAMSSALIGAGAGMIAVKTVAVAASGSAPVDKQDSAG